MDLTQRKKFIELFESEKELDNRFINIKSIDDRGGGGYFSIVFQAFDTQTKKQVALKFYDPEKCNISDRVQRFQREAEVLYQLKDEPLVINIIGNGLRTLTKELTVSGSGLTINQEYQYIALDWAEKNVDDYIHNIHDITVLDLLYIFRDIVKSIFRLHKKRICHRDIKPDNFLILDNDNIVLSDLGTSKFMDGSMPDIRNRYTTPVGHQYYWAPELFFAMGIADELVYKADFFALGSILFEMFTGAIYTLQIYDDNIFMNFQSVNDLFMRMTSSQKTKTYKQIANDLSKRIKSPDICSFNDCVPKCIKRPLNKLYKNLTEVNALIRLSKETSIYRQIDICIITLENELKTKADQEEKRRRKNIRMERKRLAFLKSKGLITYDN